MKTFIALLTGLTAVLAVPVAPAGRPQCEYSLFEKINLGHNHDVNTGQLLFGGSILKNLPKLLGSGCAPAWAVGGALTDDTPTKVPGW
jgi:hypothetical protein